MRHTWESGRVADLDKYMTPAAARLHRVWAPRLRRKSDQTLWEMRVNSYVGLTRILGYGPRTGPGAQTATVGARVGARGKLTIWSRLCAFKADPCSTPMRVLRRAYFQNRIRATA